MWWSVKGHNARSLWYQFSREKEGCKGFWSVISWEPGSITQLLCFVNNRNQDSPPVYHKVRTFVRVNTLRLRQYGRHVSDNIFKCIFLNENVWISLKIWLKFVPKDWINNIPALVQIMVGADQATHISVTRPQWVKKLTFDHLNKYIEWPHVSRTSAVYNKSSQWLPNTPLPASVNALLVNCASAKNMKKSQGFHSSETWTQYVVQPTQCINQLSKLIRQNI